MRELKVITTCARCGGEIYDCEQYYAEDEQGRAICTDCVEDELNRLSIEEKIKLLGYDIHEVQRCKEYLSGCLSLD